MAHRDVRGPDHRTHDRIWKHKSDPAWISTDNYLERTTRAHLRRRYRACPESETRDRNGRVAAHRTACRRSLAATGGFEVELGHGAGLWREYLAAFVDQYLIRQRITARESVSH